MPQSKQFQVARKSDRSPVKTSRFAQSAIAQPKKSPESSPCSLNPYSLPEHKQNKQLSKRSRFRSLFLRSTALGGTILFFLHFS
ncbi:MULTISPECIES: hypothetical protein [Spirulina sp. CCY15215]|uniref:hypothetical protein n=1 Tax=Spirulina sp. CCY15215 TaxID=2767591 RepID=UPI00194F258D|nr:hypothetical protein [Spirulina major]